MLDICIVTFAPYAIVEALSVTFNLQTAVNVTPPRVQTIGVSTWNAVLFDVLLTADIVLSPDTYSHA